MKKVFLLEEKALCYRCVYIEAESEKEARKKWENGEDYLTADEWGPDLFDIELTNVAECDEELDY